jgi:hypothetical protein
LFHHEEEGQDTIKRTIGIDAKQSHQTGFEQASLKEGEKQPPPLNTK